MSDITKELPLTNVKTWSERSQYTLAYTIQGYIALGYKISSVVPLIYTKDGGDSILTKALIVFEK